MIDESQLTKEQKVQRSEEARRLLEHPLMREAFANLRQNYYEAWRDTPPTSTDELAALHIASQVVAAVENHLRVVMAAGHVERAQLSRLGKRQA